MLDTHRIIVDLAKNARATIESIAEEAGLKRGTWEWCLALAGVCRATEEKICALDGRCIFCMEPGHGPLPDGWREAKVEPVDFWRMQYRLLPKRPA